MKEVNYAFDEESKPCSCKKEKDTIKIVWQKVGYSDSLDLILQCQKCGHSWYEWIEG